MEVLRSDKQVPQEMKNAALLAATVSGAEDVVRVLVQGGADSNAKSADGRTALHYAVMGGFSSLTSYLVRCRADMS